MWIPFPCFDVGAESLRVHDTTLLKPMQQTLLDWLEKRYPQAKRTTLRRMLQAGRITINGQAAKSVKQTITATDSVVVSDKPEAPAREKPSQLQIVYEDQDILVANKPAGLLTATVAREPRPTLLAMVWEYVRSNEPRAQVGLIHRLDRDASGLLIFSKNDDAYASLKRQFFRHSVHRQYLAVVQGVPQPPKGTIESHLVERADGTVHSTRQIGKGEKAISNYEVLKTVGKQSLVKVVLQTGRKHQIRVHLTSRGTPIVGDSVYGPKSTSGPLLLVANRLVIEHPRDGKERVFEIDLPAHFPDEFRGGLLR
jgi:23S rRNA pseudouridine1911/1915/1917 synthase